MVSTTTSFTTRQEYLAEHPKAPSYFSQFFEEQLRQNEGADSVRTLYIDRDPTTFEDISLHLQGYHIEPRDGPHFVKLFADAQFFSCELAHHYGSCSQTNL